MRKMLRGATLLAVTVACGGGGPDTDGAGNAGSGGTAGSSGAGGSGGTSGSTGSGGSGGSDLLPVRPCVREMIAPEDDLVHDLGSDGSSFYWLGLDDGITVFALPKAGGGVRVVTSFPDYTAYLLDLTDLAVSGDSQLLMDDLVADDHDDYLYFSGDTQIWRVKKDGTEEVQAVSGEALNELGPATCNFSRSQLRQDGLFACRDGQIFQMTRDGVVGARVVYSAPEGSRIDGFAVSGEYLYTNGPYDPARHFAPLLRVSIATGEVVEFGDMLESLVPSAIVIIGGDLLFSSLFLASDAPDLETASEWATRQGTYRVGLDGGALAKISDDDIQLVRGADVDAEHVYYVVGDQIIRRMSADGRSETFVDCRESAGGIDDFRFAELHVDDHGVYVRDDDGFYRFDK